MSPSVRSIHEYTIEFMRLAKRNNLRESEGQNAARYLEGLKPQIRDKIGVQVMRNLLEAKNMALKDEFIMQDRGRYESSRRSFGGDNSRASVENEVIVQEMQPRNERFQEDKAAGKQKVVETKEGPKAANR